MQVATIAELKEAWRVAKVKLGDMHPGNINKIELIHRHKLQRHDITYPTTCEMFGVVRGHGPVHTMRDLEYMANRFGSLVLDLRTYDRTTGHERKAGIIRYRQAA